MSVTGFAVDLGGTKTAAARIEAGRVMARAQSATDGSADAPQQIAAMAALLAGLGYTAGAPLGVAVAGRVDSDGLWQAMNTETFSGLGAVPLAATLAARFGPRARALNDAAAAALAEARLGAGQQATNFAFLTVSTGVGGGLVIGGRLVESRNGLAGHVGFMGARAGTLRCGSGRIGTVESVASGRALAAAAGLADARAVFADPRHAALIDRSAATIAALVADLTAALGLDTVAVGGGVGLAPGYLARVAAHLAAEPPLFRPRLVPAALGHDAGLIGALLYAQEAP